MSKAHGWTGLRAVALALGLFSAAAGGARADALMNYSTQGSIDTATGITGAGAISFIPVTSNTFSAPSAFSLGDFQVLGLQPGQSTSYSHTPFSITFVANSVDGVKPVPNQTPIVVKGELNGTVTGADQSSVKASFSPIATSQFQTGAYMNSLSIPDNPITLVPSSTNGGHSTAQANLDTSPVKGPIVPEPTSIAMFLTTLGGLGLRRRLRRGQAA